jgi:leucyl/phenylalanyl-tRNA--protein transferase
MVEFIEDNEFYFPPIVVADDDGLLAVTTDFSLRRILLAYQKGIFPWFEDKGLFYWYSTNPRCVLFPEKLYISKSMQKVIRDKKFTFTFNQSFNQVIINCALAIRKPVFLDGVINSNSGTWITRNFLDQYTELHLDGLAVSGEAWLDGKLVGGLYGVLLDRVFYGESMFATESNASKFAFIQLVEHLKVSNQIQIIDCQSRSTHLLSLGAETIPIERFAQLIDVNIDRDYSSLY